MENKVYCLLVEEEIEDIECIENVDCIVGIQRETSMPKRYQKRKSWKEVCKKCKYHNM